MSSLDDMLLRLEEVEARFTEINERMADPSVAGDANAYRKLAKEHSELKEVVDAFRALRNIREGLEEAESIIKSGEDEELAELAREELGELQQREKESIENLQILLLPKDPNDEKNVILEIRAGTGGNEAAIFAGDLFRMYQRFAEVQRWKLDIMSANPGSAGGFKEIISSIEGNEVYSQLKFESGVHRVQRVPETESQGRIHTSAVTVAILPEAEDVEVEIEDKDLRIDVYRSSGPGGQSVNTTDSAVRINHLPTGITISCQDEKSQHKNKAKAMKILRAKLYDLMLAEQQAEISEQRRAMVRSGDRSEKIRTYNFPQDRCTDHRIGLTMHNLDKILAGGLNELITALRSYHQAEALKGQ